MRVVSPGRFEVTINGASRVIAVPLGLRSEIYQLISAKQVEYFNASKANMLPDSVKERVDAAKERLAALEEAPEKDETTIAAAKSELNEVYNEALEHIQRNSEELTKTLAKKQADLTGKAAAEALALLLSERDDYGKITMQVTPDEILWGETYMNDQDELLTLLEAVTMYVTESLKKVSNIGAMISAVSVGTAR